LAPARRRSGTAAGRRAHGDATASGQTG
jgi:hypothetical protein